MSSIWLNCRPIIMATAKKYFNKEIFHKNHTDRQTENYECFKQINVHSAFTTLPPF